MIGKVLSKSVDGESLFLRLSKQGELKTTSIVVNDEVMKRYAINKISLGDYVEVEIVDFDNECTFLKHREEMMFAEKYL